MRLSPESGIIRSSLELLSTTDEDRPRGTLKSPKIEITAPIDEMSESTEEAGQSDPKRAKRVTAAEREDAMLPNLKPAPGIEMLNTYLHLLRLDVCLLV